MKYKAQRSDEKHAMLAAVKVAVLLRAVKASNAHIVLVQCPCTPQAAARVSLADCVAGRMTLAAAASGFQDAVAARAYRVGELHFPGICANQVELGNQ